MSGRAGRSEGPGARPAQRLHATVFGLVQGVGFRWFVRREAERLGLVGWVANRADGSVELVAEGESGALDRLVERLRDGPAQAEIARVAVGRGPALGGMARFEIAAGAHRGD